MTDAPITRLQAIHAWADAYKVALAFAFADENPDADAFLDALDALRDFPTDAPALDAAERAQTALNRRWSRS